MADHERLLRIVTDKHYKTNGDLKPSAFPVTDVKRRGVSLVRGDCIDFAELGAIASDILRLSKANEVRGALVAAANSLKSKVDGSGARALCVIDDPVRDEENVRDNEAHAITLASMNLHDPDVLELRDWLLQLFSGAKTLESIHA